MFTYLVGWHASAVSLPPADVIFAQLNCPLNDIIFFLHQGDQKIGKTSPKFWKKKPKELPKPINGTIIYITPF
jgi:hypothetical protein